MARSGVDRAIISSRTHRLEVSERRSWGHRHRTTASTYERCSSGRCTGAEFAVGWLDARRRSRQRGARVRDPLETFLGRVFSLLEDYFIDPSSRSRRFAGRRTEERRHRAATQSGMTSVRDLWGPAAVKAGAEVGSPQARAGRFRKWRPIYPGRAPSVPSGADNSGQVRHLEAMPTSRISTKCAGHRGCDRPRTADS